MNTDYVFENGRKDLPIPVFSSVTPHTPVPFLLHMMLMCGKYETELYFRMQETMRNRLVFAKLIRNKTDEKSLQEYSWDLMWLLFTKIFPVQPVSLRRLENFTVTVKRLFDGILLHDEVPIMGLPPCILTKFLDERDEKLNAFWNEKRKNQLDSIYKSLPARMNIPSQEDVFNATKPYLQYGMYRLQKHILSL